MPDGGLGAVGRGGRGCAIRAAATFAPDALVLNPASAVRLETTGGRPSALHWRGLAPRRSWRPLRLKAEGADTPLFNAAWDLLEAGIGLPPAVVALRLWQAGLLLTPAERAVVPDGPGPVLETSDAAIPDWQPPDIAGAGLWRRLFADFDALATAPATPPPASAATSFAAGRWVRLGRLLSGTEAATAAGIWRCLDTADLMRPVADLGAGINNDPLGRALLRRLTPIVERVVGRPLRPSYSFAMAYRSGATVPVHTDRRHCEYTVSLLLDHLPLPADGVSPWPLEVALQPEAGPARFRQAPGEGILICGRELPHGRPPLAGSALSLVLMLHWVDAHFPDADMDRS